MDLLSTMNIKEYMDLLASNAPAPGGGSASALCGSQGASLTAMVCNLTLGKEKYKEHEALVSDVKVKCEKLKDEFLNLMDEDTKTFKVMEDVFSMPKDTDEQKAARREAMQNAMKVCCATPKKIMENALLALRATYSIVGKSNQSAASDLGVAALNLRTCVCGAWLNVLINIGGIKDEAFVKEHRELENTILKEALDLSEKIYNEVKNSL
ncbi:MAG: cyclodeaminase/cyclohydrolase family protein [Lachnospiraceae bacterium]|nr:cyclodeaminase/cyclohydrolase family protein [Lachnospiraceae bacterium]